MTASSCCRPLLLLLSFALFAEGIASCEKTACAEPPPMRAVYDDSTGTVDLFEGSRIVLRYRYHTVEPPAGRLERVAPAARKYAQPRSDYIHPLYGPDGEVLTMDWALDHPHHRGVYWAWPEVDYRGERGDLHALQQVFARPTGKLSYRGGDRFAEIRAENEWRWKDQTPIVREVVQIRAYRSDTDGRFIDLTFGFTAIGDDVALARRGTTKYGGLNIRFAKLEQLSIDSHLGTDSESPPPAWAEISGVPERGKRPVAVTIFQKAANPNYPGDWVDFPHLPWLQPTFPASGQRYVLRKGDPPLVLQYRLWIHPKRALTADDYRSRWQQYQSVPSR